MSVTAKNIDWDAYKTDLQSAIENESLWQRGAPAESKHFHKENIANLRSEIELLDNKKYEEILKKHD